MVYEGLWHANGERYKVLMRPSPRSSGKKGQLQVGALHMKDGAGAADTAGETLGGFSLDLARCLHMVACKGVCLVLGVVLPDTISLGVDDTCCVGVVCMPHTC